MLCIGEVGSLASGGNPISGLGAFEWRMGSQNCDISVSGIAEWTLGN